jgi:hypothetical protein
MTLVKGRRPTRKGPRLSGKGPLPRRKSPMPAGNAPLPRRKGPLPGGKRPLPRSNGPLSMNKGRFPDPRGPFPIGRGDSSRERPTFPKRTHRSTRGKRRLNNPHPADRRRRGGERSGDHRERRSRPPQDPHPSCARLCREARAGLRGRDGRRRVGGSARVVRMAVQHRRRQDVGHGTPTLQAKTTGDRGRFLGRRL